MFEVKQQRNKAREGLVCIRYRDIFELQPQLMKNQYLLPVFIVLALSACRKEANPQGEIPLKLYGCLEVKVLLCVDDKCDSARFVPDARVYLFDFESNREQGFPIAREGTTNGQGEALFANLEEKEYWLTIKMPSPEERLKKEYARTPQRSISYLQVFFSPK